MGFYMLFLKPPILMHSCAIHTCTPVVIIQ